MGFPGEPGKLSLSLDTHGSNTGKSLAEIPIFSLHTPDFQLKFGISPCSSVLQELVVKSRNLQLLWWGFLRVPVFYLFSLGRIEDIL